MTSDQNRANRSRDDIISDLENLTHEDGFVYTMCGLVRSSLFYPPEEAAEINWHERLNMAELSYLLGLMVKAPIHIERLPSIETWGRQFTSAQTLMAELHTTYASDIGSLIERSTSDEDNSNQETAVEFDDDQMVEAIFYGPNGADEFSYLEAAATRYQKDEPWIKNNTEMTLESMSTIAIELKELKQIKLNRTGEFSSHKNFCENLLNVFTFQFSDLSSQSEDQVRSFVKAFALEPGTCNSEFRNPGEYNEVQSRPLIKIDEDRFLIAICYDLMESIYLSPYYWMLEDEQYQVYANTHRGEATEQIASGLLGDVFGIDNVYEGVKVRQGRDDVTDIDVLAVYHDRAVVVQAKSKKLTVEARTGNVAALKRDFQHAIQDAYEQGLIARKALTCNKFTFWDSENRPITLPGSIRDVYIICLTGDDYPAIVSQLRKYLNRQDDDPYPLAISIFDLEVLAHYLNVPIDFLYYARQRTNHTDYFLAISELSFLGYHLQIGLQPAREADLIMVDSNGYFQLVDADYMVEKGMYPERARPKEFVWRWRDPVIDQLVKHLSKVGFEKHIEVAFFLYDMGELGLRQMRDLFMSLEIRTNQRQEISDGSFMFDSGKRGATLIVYPKGRTSATEHFSMFADVRKYKAQSQEWLALGRFEGSSNLFDMVSFNDNEWKYDPDMERAVRILLKPGIGLRPDGTKIGRNERCFCGSGKKFKRCHGSRSM